jgi:predicted amidohydrolase YtcJ
MSRAPAKADLLLTGGRVYTVDAADRVVEAVAIGGDRILAAGPASALAGLVGPRTRTVRLGGRSVVPGLVDGHAHMEREALKRLRPSLAGATRVAEVLARVSAAANATPRGRWVVTMPLGDPPFYFGGPDALLERRLPTCAELDAAAPDHPVCIPGAFGNWGRPPGYTVLNSAGLAAAGITAASRPACEGVQVELDAATGEPTGVIVEHNYRPSLEFDLLRGLPCFGYEQRLQALLDSIPLYQALGTTSIYEGHGSAPESIAIYRDAWERGRLTVRTCLCVSPAWSGLAEARLAMRDWLAYARGRGMGDPWLRICGVYLGLGGDPAHAALARASLPNTGWTGYVEWANGLADFRELAMLAAHHDLRVNAVVGERLPEALEALEAVDRVHPLRGRRWVIEHIGRMRPDDLPRIRALGLMVTTIPTYSLWKDGDAYLDDPDGGEWTLPHRALMEAGLPIAAGTDNVPFSPFWPMWAAIARVERTTGRTLGTSQSLDRRQALRLMTIEGARLSFEEELKGSIEPGKYADLAVLDADPGEVALDALRDVASVMTVVGGRVVHHRPWD